MITVSGSDSGYAIMKQVQQLKLRYPKMDVVTLDVNTSFSALLPGETLYLIGHGSMSTGDLKDIKRDELLKWLTDQDRGVPQSFGGIVILSCYSGLVAKPSKGSLAAFLASGLKGRVAAGTPVEGANGFSFGTPEFRKSGRSSVLCMDLAAFYFATSDEEMTKAWLKHQPTHTEGVLKDKLGINVDTGKTIEEHLETVQQSQGKTPEKITGEYVASFANQAKAIEGELTDIIQDKIPGNSVADKAAYMMEKEQQPDVEAWNKAIDRQYQLFHDLYLWAPAADAFTAVKVG